MGVHTNRDNSEQIVEEVVSIFYTDGIIIMIAFSWPRQDRYSHKKP